MNRFACIFLLLLAACTAKEENPAKEAVPLEQTADSVSNAKIDGTETVTGPPTDVKQELPQTLN